MIEILETRPGQPDFPLFRDFPKEIYPPDSPYFHLPETLPEAFLAGCYLLVERGQVRARAALYHNPQLLYQNQKTCCVGQYEATPEVPHGRQLLEHIAAEARALGAAFLLGPMNGSTWETYRFSLHHRYPPFFLEPYHHLYYHAHFAQAGLGAIGRYVSHKDTTLRFDHPEVLARDRALSAQGVVIRPIDLLRYEQELVRIHAFTALAFQKNFLYTPIDQDAFVQKYLPARPFVHPQCTLLAEDAAQNLIGYFFCLDDVWNQTEKSLIVKTLARHPAERWRGLGRVIGNRIYQIATGLGYQSIIHPFIFEQGTSTTLSSHFSGQSYKEYILYGKYLH
ncbi:hypothetical protein GCM10027275_04180 [Rhabdobacter roseus]|uniref:GNAT superfamily N-acetyltransferase n=1 Tax=Rhabdobacter roseus TaxID=1655419 RepID=A0A840TQM9_9BACT|nr:hypothetical protein [Rhabdobacter roseus]MBB5282308.1 GNAT superfamily N-acetyltransferase [Rhabdobacter roseus]